MSGTQTRVAVFIDAENIGACHAGKIIEGCTRLGTITARRVYGNFAHGCLKPWLDAAPIHALNIRSTIIGAAGKNGADMALAIDAMEMLCRDQADVFCLVTSDGDFTQLAMHIRERGKAAVGFGSTKASLQFRAACGQFIEIKNDRAKSSAESHALAVPISGDLRKLWPIVRAGLSAINLDAQGWTDLPKLASAIRAVDPAFKPQAYGASQLKKLVLKFDHLETRMGENNQFQLRLKPMRVLETA